MTPPRSRTRPITLPRRQRGIALLVALLTVALALILIAGLLDRGELTLARTRNVLRGEQAQAYAQGLEAYAAEVLMRDLDDSRDLDSSSDIWAFPLPPQPVPGGVISATLRDLNGCLNLNNLAPDLPGAATSRKLLERLLGVHGLDPTLADAVVDWLDADADTEGRGGAEDGHYLGQSPPYRAANRSFAHVSELRLVRGFDGAAYARLAPDVCALPGGTRLNINTASVAVLQALDLQGRLTQAMAQSLWQNGQARWNSVQELTTQLAEQSIVLDPAVLSRLGVASTYFLARGDIRLDDIPFTFYSVLERRVGAGIRVIARSRGGEEARQPRPPP